MSSEARLRWGGYVRRWIVVVSVATVAMIVAMHATNPPRLEAFRVPSDLHRTSNIWGLDWPESFHTYHAFLLGLSLSLIVLWKGLPRLTEQRWAVACTSAGALGATLSACTFLYFGLQLPSDRVFTRLDVESAAIVAIYSLGLIVLFLSALFLSATALPATVSEGTATDE